jgi:hypothetical protein
VHTTEAGEVRIPNKDTKGLNSSSVLVAVPSLRDSKHRTKKWEQVAKGTRLDLPLMNADCPPAAETAPSFTGTWGRFFGTSSGQGGWCCVSRPPSRHAPTTAPARRPQALGLLLEQLLQLRCRKSQEVGYGSLPETQSYGPSVQRAPCSLGDGIFGHLSDACDAFPSSACLISSAVTLILLESAPSKPTFSLCRAALGTHPRTVSASPELGPFLLGA